MAKANKKNAFSAPKVENGHELLHSIWKLQPRNVTEDSHNPSPPNDTANKNDSSKS